MMLRSCLLWSTKLPIKSDYRACKLLNYSFLEIISFGKTKLKQWLLHKKQERSEISTAYKHTGAQGSEASAVGQPHT